MMTEATTVPSNWAQPFPECSKDRGQSVVVQSRRRANTAQGTLIAESNWQAQHNDIGTAKAENLRFVDFRRALPPMRVSKETFSLVEKFDGVVLSVDDKAFVARLFPSEAETHPAVAEFPRSELSDEDQALLFAGAPFVLTIGFRTSGSSRKRESSFYMRRMPAWSEEELNRATERAKTFSETVGWK